MVGGLQPPSLEDEEEQKRVSGQGVIFVLEDAQLEVAQVGKVSTMFC
jgi:rRNA small subunit pseudouridine methyltransferase Nep1